MTTTEVSYSLERVDNIIKYARRNHGPYGRFFVRGRGMAFQHYRNVTHLALCHARNLRKPGGQQTRLVRRPGDRQFRQIKKTPEAARGDEASPVYAGLSVAVRSNGRKTQAFKSYLLWMTITRGGTLLPRCYWRSTGRYDVVRR
jgi:hypothetical protein